MLGRVDELFLEILHHPHGQLAAAVIDRLVLRLLCVYVSTGIVTK